MTGTEYRAMRFMPKGPMHISMFAGYLSLVLNRKVDNSEARTLIDAFNQRMREENDDEGWDIIGNIERRAW